MMIPLLVLVAWVLLTVWPLFFRRWKYWKYLLPLSNFIVIALGAWLLCYFQMERNFTRGAEAEAVSTTRNYLKNGGDPAILSLKLEAVSDSPQPVTPRGVMRRWLDAIPLLPEERP